VLMVFSMVGLVRSPGTELTAVWPALKEPRLERPRLATNGS
jgi:hypothetical protein